MFSVLEGMAKDNAKMIDKHGTVGVSRGYTDHYQGRGQAIRPTATLINIHEPLI